MIDLHAHSTASDGSLRPAELIQLAVAEGLQAVALTDHDTVSGLDEALEESRRHAIRFVPGIELEVDFANGVFHLLGLGLQDWSGENAAQLELAQRFRETRNREIVRLLNEGGIGLEYEELIQLAGHHNVGRPHFARWLMLNGHVSSFQEAFDTMIGDGGPYYVEKRGLSVGRTCDIVHAAGGVAVLAHPQTLRMNWDDLQLSLKRWRGEGLDGVEAYHANLTCNDGHRIAAMADELGLFTTAGSDFHTPEGGRRLGRSCDDRKIEDRFLDAIPPPREDNDGIR
jgi:predicted metal-dependent phosphoesterase TrpH